MFYSLWWSLKVKLCMFPSKCITLSCNFKGNFYNMNFLLGINLVTAVTTLKSSSKITSYFYKFSPLKEKRLIYHFLFKMTMPPLDFWPQNILEKIDHILLSGIFQWSNSSDMKFRPRCFLLIICLTYLQISAD